MHDREEKRLTKEPFKTMVSVPDTIADLLRGWKEPKDTAYILFQTKNYEISAEQWKDGTFTLNVDGRPEQYDKVTYYVMKKGYKIIHYGNFPRANHPNPAIAKKARMHTGKDQVNPWDALESHCRSFMKVEAERTERISELEKKLADKTKELEAVKKKNAA